MTSLTSTRVAGEWRKNRWGRGRWRSWRRLQVCLNFNFDQANSSSSCQRSQAKPSFVNYAVSVYGAIQCLITLSHRVYGTVDWKRRYLLKLASSSFSSSSPLSGLNNKAFSFLVKKERILGIFWRSLTHAWEHVESGKQRGERRTTGWEISCWVNF